MSKPMFSAERPIKLESITKPVVDDDWGTAMFDYGISTFGETILLNSQNSLTVNLITGFERDRASRLSVDKAAIVKKGLHVFRTQIFNTDITVPTERVIIRHPKQVLVGLQYNEALVHERHAVLALLSLATGLDFPDSYKFFFNVDLGFITERDMPGKVIQGFENNGLPPEVTLGKSTEILTNLETGQVI